MQRLIITGPRRAEFEETSPPVCGDDEVLVRADTTAISTGTELRVYRAIPVDEAGRFLHESVPFQLPAENGYSMVGHLIETGRRVTALKTGMRVFAPAPHRLLAAVDAARVTPIPDAVPDDEAVFLSILEVAHQAIRRGDPQAGANVLIVGQGVIGLSVLAYSIAFGWRTAVIDLDSQRLDIAREMGAGLAVSPDDSQAADRVLDYFGGAGADVAFEAASHWSAVRTAMELTRTDGRVVIVSRHTERPNFNPVGHPFLGKRLSLLTSYGYPLAGSRWEHEASVKLTVDLLQQRRLPIGPLLTHHFNWRELPSVYARLDEGDRSIVGAVINWRE
ncbi:MAG: zinc-binding dehydrogenase [Pirellulaceae bacterium]|jgi:threonine dehydrogenase-like Zn-dependent dehydrogenase|nr:zinc-binding dehydrogenase [Pirellulaceae bacterium]